MAKKRKRRSVPVKAKPIPKELLKYPQNLAEAMNDLSIKERNFVTAYCGRARGNASLAVKLAKLSAPDATVIARSARGSQLTQDPRIRKAIDAWMQTYSLGAAEVTWAFKDMTEINPTPFFEVTSEGKLKIKEKMDADEWEAHAHWVKSIQVNKDGIVTMLELHDRHAALRDHAKILRLWSDQPIFAFNMYVQRMSDQDLLTEIAKARAEEEGLMTGVRGQLSPGDRIADVPPPKEGT